MLLPEDHQALAQIVGDSAVLTGAATAGYEMPARYAPGVASAVIRPANTGEVSAVVRHCVRHKVKFLAQSGNTGLVAGSTPDASGTQLIVSLDRMRSPLDLNLTNRSLTVGAGVRLSSVNELLQTYGLFLPIDLGADPMIGGMIATNTGGARFLRYGDMRRHVLGLEVVLSDSEGTVLDLCSALRKDNTGVDLKHLFIGTGGAFGIVTRAVLGVQACPSASAVALAVPADERDAPMALLELIEKCAGNDLSAFEAMSANAMGAALRHMPTLANPFGTEIPSYAVLIELAGAGPSNSFEEKMASALEHALSEGIIVDAVIGRGASLWALRHSLSEGLRAAGCVLGFDLAFGRDRVLAFRRHMIDVLAARYPGYQVCDFGHLGDGGVHFSLLRPHHASDSDDATLIDLVYEVAVTRFGGSFSGEHGIGRANQHIYDRYKPRPQRHLAGRLAALLAEGSCGVPRFGLAS